jgi:hypothetical protein
MQAKTIPQPVDPNLANEQAAAKKQVVDQLQIQAQDDTAAMMARYGTKLALSNVISPSAPGTAAVGTI